MSSLGERLRISREKRGLSQTEVYRRTRINNKTLSRYEKNGSEPDRETLIKLAELYEVDFEWLVKGENKYKLFVSEKTAEYKASNHVFLPVLGTIRAGQPLLMNKQYDEYETIEPSVLKGREAFVLRVQGNSMSGDRIYDGDKVVIVVQNYVEPHEIAVVAVNGDEATLKRVKCQDGMCMLIPSNPDMTPMMYPAHDIHIIGKVIEQRRSFE